MRWCVLCYQGVEGKRQSENKMLSLPISVPGLKKEALETRLLYLPFIPSCIALQMNHSMLLPQVQRVAHSAC